MRGLRHSAVFALLMKLDDADAAPVREIRRFRAVWTGVLAGSILVTVGVVTVAVVWAAPMWHHSPGDFPGEELRWFLVGAGVAVAVPVLVHVGARLRPSATFDRIDVAVTVLGVAALVAILIATSDDRRAASTVQTLPGVVGVGRVLMFVCVLGVIIGLVNFLARRARVEHRSRHRLRRRFGAAFAASTALLATVAAVVAWPQGVSPTVDQATARGIGWVPQGFQNDVRRIDWHSSLRPAAWTSIAPAPIAGGFAVADDTSVTAFVGATQSWRIQFQRPVIGLWGPVVDASNTASPVVVQVRDLTTRTLLTYGVDGETGRIDWVTDAVDDIKAGRFDDAGAMILTWSDDRSVSVGELSLADGVYAGRVSVPPTDGQCERPERFDFVDGAVALPVVCGHGPRTVDAYDYSTGKRVHTYTGRDFGAPDASVRVSASVGSVAALAVEDGDRRKTVFVASRGTAAPDGLPAGWTVTGLARSNDDWTITGVDPAGHAAVIYSNPVRRTRSTGSTQAVGDRFASAWTGFGDSLVTTVAYATPIEVDDRTSFPQVAPLTFVGPSIPGSGTLQPPPNVTMKTSPCRLTRDSTSSVFTVGGGVLIRCNGGSPESRELFLLR